MGEHLQGPEPSYEPPAPRLTPRPRRGGWRRAGRLAALVLAGLFGLIFLAVVGALIWLHTGTGAQRLGLIVAEQARNAIRGDLRVRAIHVSGFLSICVDGADLRDPDGNRALAADRICVSLNPIALRAKRIAVREVVLERPWVELAAVQGPDGKRTTTLARALEPKIASATEQKPAGAFDWTIDVRSLKLRDGHAAIRPGVGEAATFELGALEIADAHARYASDGANLGIQLAAQLAHPGRAPVGLDAEATLAGPVQTGRAELRALRVRLGDSGLTATGAFDLGPSTGELRVRELRVRPADVMALMPPRAGSSTEGLLAGEIRGEIDLRAEAKTAIAELRLQAGGGRIAAKGAVSRGAGEPEWSIDLTTQSIDPAGISPAAPHGDVTARVNASGKGTPRFDRRGIQGDLRADVHVGPARLERVGPVVADLKANVDGRYAIVRAFSATALGLSLKAKGTAAPDDVSLDVALDAPSLAEVGRAVGALTRKPSLPVAGTLHLTARVTGAPTRPDADLHARAPQLRWGPTLVAEDLAVDGTLRGELRRPDGALKVVARRLLAGGIDLGGPRADMDLRWPIAHLKIDAGVKGGALQLVGDATIDQDKDGFVLSHFLVAWPENQLRLGHDTAVHFRDEVILEPLDLIGDHGSVRVQAIYRPPSATSKGAVDAAAVLSRFDLARLPAFALPPGTQLRGVVDANAVVQGALPRPDVDLRVDWKSGGVSRLEQVAWDLQAHAHLHRSRLQTDGSIDAGDLGSLRFQGDLPLAPPASMPLSEPVQLDAELRRVDLSRLAAKANVAAGQRQGLQGIVEGRVLATGTLGAPRATISIDARGLAGRGVKDVDAHVGLLVDKGKATLDATVSLQGEPAVGMTAQEPLDLSRLLRDPTYLRGAAGRPLSLDLAVTRLTLERLAGAGLLPAGSAGTMTLGVHVAGTPLAPTLQLSAVGEQISVGKLRGLGVQGQLAVGNDVRFDLGALSQGAVVARADGKAAVSGAELVQLARNGVANRDAIAPLLDRTVSLTIDVPGLPIARAQQFAGSDRSVVEGKLEGHVALSGTPARPQLSGRVALSDLSTQKQRLGAAEVRVEADGAGAHVHVGIDPPGGGNFLGDAQLKADLGGRALLRTGAAGLREGQLSGTLRSRQLDLAFLGGLVPNVRRAAGTLDGDVTVEGTLGKPVARGEAHLRSGLFDVVGQGVFDDMGLDASFSPKEVVVDRVTGSTGNGTFSAILVAKRRDTADASRRFEFTGEVHLGDDESARGRKRPDGTPVRPGPVPIRQAGAERADVTGEVDLFGDWTNDVVTVNARIPDARVRILQLPDKKLPSLDPNPDVLLVHGGEKPHPPGKEPGSIEKEQSARKAATFRLLAHLELNHMYVQAPDFEFPVQSDLRFEYDARDPDHPSAEGTIHIPQGTFSALGRRFIIEDALITERGTQIDNPELEIRARYENPKATVTIVITGTARNPQVELSSNPPMDQDAIAFFLATGRLNGRATQTGGGVDLTGAASSVLGGLLFGQVRQALAQVLPVDVVSIETGGDKFVSAASIGKYIGDRVYIGYVARLTPAPNENQNEGRIEYEISRNVNLEATVGERNREMSLLWTHDF